MESVLAVPTSMIWIIAGRAIWNSMIGILNGLFILVIAVTVFQVPLNLNDVPLFLLAFTVTLVSLACLGLVFSSAFVLSRSAGVLTNGLEFPIYVGTGTMFPIALLPFWTHPLSLSLAPTWGIEAIRIAALSNYSQDLGVGYWGDLAIMGVLSICYLVIAVWLFKQVDHRARRDANLGRY